MTEPTDRTLTDEDIVTVGGPQAVVEDPDADDVVPTRRSSDLKSVV